MAERIIIANGNIVNEGIIFKGDILIEDGLIKRIIKKDVCSSPIQRLTFCKVIDACGLYVFPGIIDTQVHFREPGLTHKGDIYTESKAAIAGGVTTFMDMPNTLPQVLTQEILEEKYALAAHKSLANYSFFMGASNDNYEEIKKTNPAEVCGVKVFMGASTGHMLVDNDETLRNIFSLKNRLIAVHCEDEPTIQKNLDAYTKRYGLDIPIEMHPKIRSREACYTSSKKAVELAKKHNTRLHVLHISTEDEVSLFNNLTPLEQKRITSEACIHHLYFDKSDYKKSGRLIKWNPAIKNKKDKEALIKALKNDIIDVVATDHAPHTYEEKQQIYARSASGGPMVQHALPVMLELYHEKKISLPLIAQKMCHAPAICFKIKDRGFIRTGYKADVAIVDLNNPWEVSYQNILYKCLWSPLLGAKLKSRITHTLVNGHIAYERGEFNESNKGRRLEFY